MLRSKVVILGQKWSFMVKVFILSSKVVMLRSKVVILKSKLSILKSNVVILWLKVVFTHDIIFRLFYAYYILLGQYLRSIFVIFCK